MTEIRRRKLGNRTGYVACALGLLSLGAVLCFHFPSVLTTPHLRDVYSVEVLRQVLWVALGVTVVLGLASTLLHRGRIHGRVGLALGLAAIALGGSRVEVPAVEPSRYLGLDWLIIDFLLVSIIFVPLERWFIRLRSQPIFREEWKTDLCHYAGSHLLIGVTVLGITGPAVWLATHLDLGSFTQVVAAQPFLLQVIEAVIVADLVQYWVHRAFHRVPLLWRFHSIHHSSRTLDWLSGSRLHLVDIVVTRGITFIPISLLGFSSQALGAYLVFVALQSVFIHSNTRFRFRGLRWVLSTPAFHHWHHSDQPVARDKNFAISLPVLDLIFGTFHLPRDAWPKSYGIAGDPVPRGYLRQVAYPFLGRKAA